LETAPATLAESLRSTPHMRLRVAQCPHQHITAHKRGWVQPCTSMRSRKSRTLHLLALCRLAVRLAHRRCSPPVPAGPGGAPRIYGEASLLLIALLRTLWRLSYQDMHDWLVAWPALALACGLPLGHDGHPHIPSASQ
jgi:hypothetical protein